LILENAKRLKENRDFSNYPLSLAAYEDLMESRKKEAEKYDDLFKEDIVGFNIRNMESDLEYIQSDSSRIDRNTEWIKDLKKDVYLTETLSIMRDLIRTEESYAHIEAKLEAIDADRVIKP
jgi:hypothetical protein